MTTTNEIIEKLNDALIKMPPTGCIETAEHIETAIKMLENKRMEEKRKKFLRQQKPANIDIAWSELMQNILIKEQAS